MITTDKLAQAFSIGTSKEKDEYRFGTVKAVNDDGSVYVQLAQDALTRCSCLYDAAEGDRVQVCIKANGQAVVFGSIGKSEEPEPQMRCGCLDWQFDATVYNGGGGNVSSFTAEIIPSVHGFSVSDILCVTLEQTWPLQRWHDDELTNRLGMTINRGCIVTIKNIDYFPETGKFKVWVTANTQQNYSLRFKILYAVKE